MNSAASSNEALIQPRKQTMVPMLKRTRCWGNYDTANQICLRKKNENKVQYSDVDREKDRDVNNKLIDEHEDIGSITKANINIQGDMILPIRQQQNYQKFKPIPPTDDYKIHKARTVNDMLTERVDKDKNCPVFDLRDLIDNDYSYRQNGIHNVMKNDDISVENPSNSPSIGYHSHSDNIEDKDIETLSVTKDCGSRQHLAFTEHEAFMKLLKHILNDIDAPPQINVHHKENQVSATTHKLMPNIEGDQYLKNKECEEIFTKLNLESLKDERVGFKYYFPKVITSEETTARSQVSSSELIQKTREVLNAQAAEKRKIKEENSKRKYNEKLEREKKKLEAKQNYLHSHYIKKPAEGFEQTEDKRFIDRHESEEANRKYYEGDANEAKLFDKDESGSDKDNRTLSEQTESERKKEKAAQKKEWRAEVEKEQAGAKEKITMDISEAEEKSELAKAKRDKDKVKSEGAKLKGEDEVSREGFDQIKHLDSKKKSGQEELKPKDKHVVDKTEKDKLMPGEQVRTGGKGGKSTSPEKYKLDQKIKGEDEKSKAEKHDKSKEFTTKETGELNKNINKSDIDMKGDTVKSQAKTSANKPEQQTQDHGHTANKSKDGKFATSPGKDKQDLKNKGEGEKEKTEKKDKLKMSTTKESEAISEKQQAEFNKNLRKSDIDLKGDSAKSQAKPGTSKPEQTTQDLGHKAKQTKDDKFAKSPEKGKQDQKIKGEDEKAKTEKSDKSKVSETTKEPETLTEKQQAEYKKNMKKSDIDRKGDTVKLSQAQTSANKPGQPTHDLGDYTAKGGKLATSKSPVTPDLGKDKQEGPESRVSKKEKPKKKSDIDMKGIKVKTSLPGIVTVSAKEKPKKSTDVDMKGIKDETSLPAKGGDLGRDKQEGPESRVSKKEKPKKKSDIDMKSIKVKTSLPGIVTVSAKEKPKKSTDVDMKGIKDGTSLPAKGGDLGRDKQEGPESRVSKKEKPKKKSDIDMKGIKVKTSLPGIVTVSAKEKPKKSTDVDMKGIKDETSLPAKGGKLVTSKSPVTPDLGKDKQEGPESRVSKKEKPKKKTDIDMKGIKVQTSLPGIVTVSAKEKPKKSTDVDMKGIKDKTSLRGIVNVNKPTKTADEKKQEEILNREMAEASKARKEKRSTTPDRVNLKSIQIKKSPSHNLAVARVLKDVKKLKMKSVSRLHLSDMLLNRMGPVANRSLEYDSEIIVHQKLYKSPPKKVAAENEVKPMFFKTNYQKEVESDLSFGSQPTTAIDAKKILVDTQSNKGVMRYALSDRSFIEKGWTLLPTEKVVRKMNVYRMRPARPEFDWFEHNKHKSQMLYDTGERLAEFDEKGRGRWYYRNGNLALEYYDCEELNAHQRFILFSSGEPDERGRSRPPMDILATFDYNGNGIVFDHTGKIRLKYNQTEGVVLDRTLGPVSNWKWHSLNDPPVLQQVMIDTQLPHKDPRIMKLGPKTENVRLTDNEDMLAIEFDNFIKEKSKKMNETKFKPFQIKMKALKINENFSLRVLDQATVYLIFRDGKTNLKLNLGMILDHKEIVDTDIAEVGQVTTCVDKLPARTDSVAALQERVAQAQRAERARAEHSRRLRQPVPPASADRLTAAASRAPPRPFPAGGGDCAAREPTYCRRASTMAVYYQNQLM